MGVFHVDCEVAGIQRPERRTLVRGLLVDTGSEFTWLPEATLVQAGVRVAKRNLRFVMADGRSVTRAIGYAILRAEGFETVDEVVFGRRGDLNLLGARTLEGFGATVDPRKKRMVAAGPHLAARSGPRRRRQRL
jgi:predicted aspartyl protease